MIEYCVNKNLDDRNRKYFNEIDDIDVDEEVGETKDIENEDLIHREITENEPETLLGYLEKCNRRMPILSG